MILLPIPLSYYNRGRRRLNHNLFRVTLFIFIILPGGSMPFPMEDEETGLASEVVPEQSSLIRLSRLSDNSSHTLTQAESYQYSNDDAPTKGGFLRSSETGSQYTKILEDPPFLGKPCEISEDCYRLFGKSLQCEAGTCQCQTWKKIKLKWSPKGNICLGAVGHPCAVKSMCHSQKCKEGHCVSGATRSRVIPGNRRLLKEIVIHLSVTIVARFVLRLGV